MKKKILSIVLVCAVFTALLAGCGSISGRELQSVSIVKLPENNEYELFNEEVLDAGFKVGNIYLNDNDFLPENIMVKGCTKASVDEALEQAKFFINLDLSGIQAEAVYSDGKTKTVGEDELKATVKDPADLGALRDEYLGTRDYIKEFSENEDDAELYLEYAGKVANLIRAVCREYTVVVEYQGFTAEFPVRVFTNNGEWRDDSITERYELLNYKDRNGAPEILLSQMDYALGYDENEDDPGAVYEYRKIIETDGIVLIVKDRETGEEKIIDNFGTVEVVLNIECGKGETPASGEYEGYFSVGFDAEPTERFPDSFQSYEALSYPVTLVNDLNDR